MMFVIVCYTNIDDRQRVAAGLTTLTDVVQWTIDFDDCDKVLRVVARRNIAQEVRDVVQREGYVCWTVGISASAKPESGVCGRSAGVRVSASCATGAERDGLKFVSS